VFFLPVEFEHNSQEVDQIKKIFIHKFNETFEHRLEYHRFLSQTLLGVKISNYLKSIDLDTEYTGFGIFLNNVNSRTLTNPHVDVLHLADKLLPIRSRFNFLIHQNESFYMIWWSKIKWGDTSLVKHQFLNKNRLPYLSMAIPGNTIEERYQYLEDFDFQLVNPLRPCGFVNTENSHALSIGPGPRMILSVGFDISLREIYERIKNRIRT